MSFIGSSSANTHATPHAESVVTLDQIFQDITTTNDSKALNDKFRQFVPKETRDNVLSGLLNGGQDPLSVLDPERNTIGWLYILAARLNIPAAQTPSLRMIEDFCSRFNPEDARLAPERVTALAKGIVRVAESSNKLKYALTPLHDLVTRYPPNLTYLTTLHSQFVCACVATKHFSTAIPVLAIPIVNIEPSLSDISYNDNLVYHYAGGVALGALKMWREAEEFFEICVSAPAQVPAAIQMEALKKLTLVQLILYGKPTPLPKYINQVLARLFKQSSYSRFAELFPRPLPEMQSFVAKEVETFTREQNLGLVQQAIDLAPRWLIRKATQTYLTLGMDDIAKETGNPNVDQNRAIVLSMIDNGEIEATLSIDDTVTFSDTVSNVTRNDIDKALKRAQQQSTTLLELERELHANKEYLSKALKYKEDAGWGQDEDVGFNLPGGAGGAPSGAWADDSMFG